MKFFLIVAKGSKQGMPIEIKVDLFLIGSDRMCQLRKGRLGNRHCAIVSREGKLFIRDMDSGQQTFLNGDIVPAGEEWPLHKGDRIAVGTLEFMIQFRERAISTDDMEEWGNECLDEQPDKEEEFDDIYARQQTNAVSAAANIINQLNLMKGEVKGRLRVGVEQGITVIRFNDARLVEESEISLIKKEVCENLDKRNMRALLDLKNVKKMSTSAVVMLTDVFRWLQARGGSMAMCRIRSELEPGLSLLKLDKVPIFTDKKQAMSARW